METVARLLLVRITSSELGVQAPLLIVHRKVALVPTVTPVIPLVGEAGVVIPAAPEIKVQTPEPVPGAFPAKVKVVVLHLDWSIPAAATVGGL